MIICGIKATHDGAIALIDNGKLVFCYEIEKLNNNDRFAALGDVSINFLIQLLNESGYDVQDIDKIVIDGWGDIGKEKTSDQDFPLLKAIIQDWPGGELEIELAGYGQCVGKENIMKELSFEYPEKNFSYSSYMHISGHVMGAYCTSPFAEREEDSFVLVWDGASCPQLFYVSASDRKIKNLGPLFILRGNAYGNFAREFEPFNSNSFDELSIAGKVMAYIAKGKCKEKILKEFKQIFYRNQEQFHSNRTPGPTEVNKITNKTLKEFTLYGKALKVLSEDLMATFHVFIQDILIEQITYFVTKHPDYTNNFCFSGGCALNIKWNSAFRKSGLFKMMWVPPFPNDSGSAIGSACCYMIANTKSLSLTWDVYSGPQLNKLDQNSLWNSMECSIEKLANILHSSNEPVIFLNGRAELGPRALGNRSILGVPIDLSMKEKLNKIKKREDYRPVAPICIEDLAPNIFTPGSPDPLMLYDHNVKDEWKERIPAICHLDSSARLQTVNINQNPIIYNLLQEYNKLSGIPLLCNTSANFKGKGFFPDVLSAMNWGETDMIWSDQILYIKKDSHLNQLIDKKNYKL